MEFLRDPIWQFLGAVIGFLGIFFSYIFFKRQQPQKQITYEIITNTPLLSIKGNLQSKIKIYFEEKLTQSITLIIIKILNSGNMPILPNDFEKPLSLSVGDNAEILESDVFNAIPNNIHPKLTRNAKSIEISPLLLNSGDQIYIKLLLENFTEEIKVDGRIAGIQQITGKSRISASLLSILIRLLGIFIGSVFFTAVTAINIYAWSRNEYDGFTFTYIFVGLLAMITLIFGFFETYSYIKKTSQL